jgi:hypothetical protein
MPANKQTRRRQTRQKRKTTKKRAYRKHRASGNRRTHSNRRLKGGNYATDVTVKTVDGIPVEEKAVVTVPGYGTMSVSEFRRLKEDLDRNGDDLYR